MKTFLVTLWAGDFQRMDCMIDSVVLTVSDVSFNKCELYVWSGSDAWGKANRFIMSHLGLYASCFCPATSMLAVIIEDSDMPRSVADLCRLFCKPVPVDMIDETVPEVPCVC